MSNQPATPSSTGSAAASEPLTPPERIIVALDASPHSLSALRAAAQLAAAMQAELHGLFVEDTRLLRLCNSPFGREIGIFTASVRPLENVAVERQLRVMAGELRHLLARVAAEVQVRWSFHVRRGGIEQELLAEAADALLLSLGRASWLARQGIGSTANTLIRQTQRPLLLLGDREELRYPLTLVYDGSPSAERALALAIRLAARSPEPLHVLLVAPANTAADLQEALSLVLRQAEITPVITTLETPSATAPAQRDHGQEILDAIGKHSAILPAAYAALLSELQGPVLLVP
jgi:nucleotide-binding universal stress UspA family protein